MKFTKWQEYYNELQKNVALKLQSDVIVEYGEIIYQSPIIKDIRWLVTYFQGEYNVFVDQIKLNGDCERNFGASFTWKNKAMDFALEMFLVCSGRLHRRNRRCLTMLDNNPATGFYK